MKQLKSAGLLFGIGYIDKRSNWKRRQADGVLARTKLDLRDRFDDELSLTSDEAKQKFDRIFQEELDAFCADMRLANVTVQAQIERKKPFGCLPMIIGGVIILFVLFLLIGLNQQQ